MSRAVLPALLVSILCACTTVIHPPPAPADPENVILITHGKSSSLVLYDQRGDASRWAYGDWRYYAVGKKRLIDALAALFWPTRSALGRQFIESAPRSLEPLLFRMGIGIDETFVIPVERDAVDRLQQRLGNLFSANLDTRLYNPGPRLEFVQHPKPYSLLRNSNSMIAGWLRELGCEVEGLPLLSKWRVEPSAPDKNSAAAAEQLEQARTAAHTDNSPPW